MLEMLDDCAGDILYSNQGKISVKWLNTGSPSYKWTLKVHLKNAPFGTQNTFFTFTSVSQPRGCSPLGVLDIYGHFFFQFDVFILILTQQTWNQIYFYLSWWQIMSQSQDLHMKYSKIEYFNFFNLVFFKWQPANLWKTLNLLNFFFPQKESISYSNWAKNWHRPNIANGEVSRLDYKKVI